MDNIDVTVLDINKNTSAPQIYEIVTSALEAPFNDKSQLIVLNFEPDTHEFSSFGYKFFSKVMIWVCLISLAYRGVRYLIG